MIDFTAADLEEMSMSEVFEDSDFEKFGLGNNEFLRSFVCQRAQDMILLWHKQQRARTYHEHAAQLKQTFINTNSKTYIEIGHVLHRLIVTPNDIKTIQDLNN